jgi:hypothetical protein
VTNASALGLRSRQETDSAYAWATPLVLSLAAACWPQTLAAGPHLYDAGELMAACWTLGASHPPGQPVHALLAHILTWLPLGPMTARIALFSSGCALLAAGIASRLSRELAGELGASDTSAQLGGAGTALAVLLCSPVLRQALRIEVYALALALTLLSMLHVLRWALGRGLRHLWLGALVAGIAGAVHPPHALAVALVALGFVAARPALVLRQPLATVLGGVGFGLLGLCAYAYLPVRAAAGAPMWGDPRTLQGFFSYVSAEAYTHKSHGTGHVSIARELYDYSRYLFTEGGGLAAASVLALWLVARNANRGVLVGAALAAWLAVVAACIQPIEPRNPDNIAYLGPAVSFSVALGAAALAALFATRLRWVAAVGLSGLALQPAALPRAAETLHADLPALETLGSSLLESPPPRALVVATTDFAAATWMMAQATDGARPDAALFVAGLSTSSWQWAQLARHPSLSSRPVRGPGRDSHEQYRNGAILSALPHVPVALERDVGIDSTGISGPYVVLSHARRARAPPSQRSIGERLDAVITRDATRSPAGDYGAGAAIVRDYQQQRAQRLLALGRADAALAQLEASLWPLPEAQRALLRTTGQRLARALAEVVKDPDAFPVSLEDIVRFSAALLWAVGHEQAARSLLAAQAERADPRALLQLGWLQLSSGDHAAAQRSLDAFTRAAPALSAEAGDLSARLLHSL